MDYGLLLSRSLRFVWQHKSLWLFGLLLGSGGYVTDFAAGRVLERLPDLPTDLQTWQSFLSQLDPIKLGGVSGGLMVGGVALTLIFWLLATWGEAALISATLQTQQNGMVSFRLAARQGFRLLGRFIAIDTLVFFPWFLLALLALLVILVLFLGVGFLSYQNASLEAVMGATGLGLFCLLSVSCLLIPVGYLTFLFRTVAFRDSAVHGTGARVTIRHTWGVVRRRWTDILMVAVIVVAVQVGLGLLLNLVSWPITAVSAYFSLALLPSLLDLLLILPQTILQTFIVTFWTVAFLQVMNYE